MTMTLKTKFEEFRFPNFHEPIIDKFKIEGFNSVIIIHYVADPNSVNIDLIKYFLSKKGLYHSEILNVKFDEDHKFGTIKLTKTINNLKIQTNSEIPSLFSGEYIQVYIPFIESSDRVNISEVLFACECAFGELFLFYSPLSALRMQGHFTLNFADGKRGFSAEPFYVGFKVDRLKDEFRSIRDCIEGETPDSFNFPAEISSRIRIVEDENVSEHRLLKYWNCIELSFENGKKRQQFCKNTSSSIEKFISFIRCKRSLYLKNGVNYHITQNDIVLIFLFL